MTGADATAPCPTLRVAGRSGRAPLLILVAVLAALLAVLAGCSATGADKPVARTTVQVTALPSGPAFDKPVDCPGPTVTVETADGLRDALAQAAPGTVIGVADGVYDGEFVGAAVGTPQAPIWLCGSKQAVLRGPGVDSGIVLHLDQAAHWRVVGFSVTQGQKGVMADGVYGSVFQDIHITEIGDEALHLRAGSSGNVVRGSTISGTGLRTEKFGEGIYVGSAVSNWCRISACGPDRSDHNIIVGNTVTDTTAEPVDIKEGTTGGVLRDNFFNGSGLRGDADSWVDVKGNDWLIKSNRGTSAPASGFQVHSVVAGWGTGNVFDLNVADVRGPGYGFDFRPIADNEVTCANVVIAAALGMSNTPCR